MSSTKFYTMRRGIKSRCCDEGCPAYKNYGGRGIKCEWECFEDFRDDMYDTYKSGLWIERVNNNGNYSKENCVRTTPKEQQNNRRNNKMYKGLTVSQRSRKLGIKSGTIFARLKKGRPREEALGFNKREERRGLGISGNAKPVGLVKGGKIVKSRKSIHSAGIELGINHTQIRQVCNGVYKQTRGMFFTYISDKNE